MSTVSIYKVQRKEIIAIYSKRSVSWDTFLSRFLNIYSDLRMKSLTFVHYLATKFKHLRKYLIYLVIDIK